MGVFLLSGCVIGAIYELGHSFPPSGFEGIEVAQALWGAWFWMVLVVSILGRIKSHRRPQVPFLNKKNVFMGIILVLLNVLFIGSVIGYSITGEDPLLQYEQNLMGLCAVVVGPILVQVGFVVYTTLQNREETKLKHMVESQFEQIDDIDRVEYSRHRINSDSALDTGACAVILPQAKLPYNFFLFIIRVVVVVWLFCVVTLLFDVVVFDRIMQPCPMPWQ